SQEEDQSKRTKETTAGPSKQEGEVDKEWLEEVERIDDYLITRLQGIVPSALLLHLMKERLAGPSVYPGNEHVYARAIKNPEEKWASFITVEITEPTYIPTAEDRKWSKDLAAQIKRCNKQILRKQKVKKTYAQ